MAYCDLQYISHKIYYFVNIFLSSPWLQMLTKYKYNNILTKYNTKNLSGIFSTTCQHFLGCVA